MTELILPRRWDLLPPALDLVQSKLKQSDEAYMLPYTIAQIAMVRQQSELEAFESIKVLIADGRVEARGRWPRDRDGNPRKNAPIEALPAESFRFAELMLPNGEDVYFRDQLVTVRGVQIDMDQLRQALAGGEAPRLDSTVAEEAPPRPDSTEAPAPKSRKATQPLRPKGRPGTKTEQITTEMRKMDPTELRAKKLKELAAQFHAAQSTCREARNTALE
jgi:hypothetical protein